MSGSLHEKVAVITGAAKGIGAATARLLSARGAALVLCDVDGEGGSRLASELPNAQFLRVDVTREADLAEAVDLAVSRHGKLDIMVNNAGLIGAMGSIAGLPAESWRKTMSILLDGVFFGAKHAARVMIPRRTGRILFTTSTAGVAAGLGAHAYTAAKHGVVGLMKSVAAELAPFGITANAVAPGPTVTALAVKFLGGEEIANDFSAKESPLGMPIHAEDIAHAFLFLAGDGARNISGQTIMVDGGAMNLGRGSGAIFYGNDPRFAD